MKIDVKWFDGKYPQFNLSLASKDGAEPFLEIKGCKIVEGKNGPFVSWPATKNMTTGKFWNHVYGSEKFNAVVLAKANAARQPQQSQDDDGPPF